MTTPLRCLVVDDKPLALDILTDYIGKVSFLHLVAAFDNPLDALNCVSEQPIDLIFLDIQMPQLTGLQFLKALQGRAAVVLTTAYAEYALDGFENDVVDYLLKPISFERFFRAAQKAQTRRRPALEQQPTNSLAGGAAPDSARLFLFVKTEHRMQRVDLEQILYAEGLQNYVILHTLTEKIIARQTISSLEDALPGTAFVRVHKSFIVGLAHVNTVERSRIYMQHSPAVIPVGEAYQEAFYKRLEG